jgi:hypothetical protein
VRAALELLRLATDRWPPPGGRRHSLYRADDGVLTLLLWLSDGTTQPVRLDGEGDLDLSPEDIVSTAASIMVGPAS